MARSKLSSLSSRRTEPASRPALPAGIHAGVVESATSPGYSVRLADGQLVAAELAESMDAQLAEECLRERRTVLVTSAPKGPVILGALQTRPSATSVDADRRANVRGAEIELLADRRLTLRAGTTELTLDEQGAIRLEGERFTIDVSALLRVLSAKVELP